MKAPSASTKDIRNISQMDDSKYLTEYGIELYNKPSELCGCAIDCISRGEFANEYADEIAFFDKEAIALSKRLIPPYVTTQTHGAEVFTDLYRLVKDLDSESILDLGCGAGEFLNGIKNKDIYGCTIHLGEREYARTIYGINSVLPLDMREIDLAFKPNSLDLVIAHCCLHFVIPEDRIKVINAAHKVLKNNGHLIVVDYKFNKETGIDISKLSGWKITYPKYKVMGNLTLLKKINE